MMKIFFLIGSFLFINNLLSQEFKYITTKLDDSCTVIEHTLKEYYKEEYVIYLDKKYWTEDKEKLSDFSQEESILKQLGPRFNHFAKECKREELTPVTLPQNWVMLQQYKGELVLNNCIEVNLKFCLTDSMLIKFDRGSAEMFLFKNTTFIDDQYNFTPCDEEISGIEFSIRIIDKERQIALFEVKGSPSPKQALLIPTKSIPLFNIISTLSYGVNYDLECDITEKVNIEKVLSSFKQ